MFFFLFVPRDTCSRQAFRFTSLNLSKIFHAFFSEIHINVQREHVSFRTNSTSLRSQFSGKN